jgi:hypothetical protein
MPSNNPKFLMDMLHNVESGKTVKGKSGNLTITKTEHGRLLLVKHFGTTILEIDFDQIGANKVRYQYGESQTDARYLNCILSHYNLSHFFDIGYGSVNGWRFSLMKDMEGGEILPKKEWKEDFNYCGGKQNA